MALRENHNDVPDRQWLNGIPGDIPDESGGGRLQRATETSKQGRAAQQAMRTATDIMHEGPERLGMQFIPLQIHLSTGNCGARKAHKLRQHGTRME